MTTTKERGAKTPSYPAIQARLDSGNLITYLAGGAQYIAIPIGGASQRAELVALRLPTP